MKNYIPTIMCLVAAISFCVIARVSGHLGFWIVGVSAFVIAGFSFQLDMYTAENGKYFDGPTEETEKLVSIPPNTPGFPPPSMFFDEQIVGTVFRKDGIEYQRQMDGSWKPYEKGPATDG